LLLLAGAAGASLLWTPAPATRRSLAATAAHLERELFGSGPSPVGTSGAAAPRAIAGDAAPAAIRDVETITGSIDGHELVGRRVDLNVPVLGRAGNIGFWVGPRDNRVLVVTRATSGSRQRRKRQAQAAPPVPAAGQRVAVTGIIRPLAPEAAKWPVAERNRVELADRTIFIRAD
jgi:hypothetical protein